MIEKLPVLRLAGETKNSTGDIVAKEVPLNVTLNNQEIATLFCSPINLEYLALGFLLSQGLVKSKEEIKKIAVEEHKGEVKVETDGTKGSAELLSRRAITSSGGKELFHSLVINQKKVASKIQISPSEIFALMKEFQHCSEVYKATGGTHSAALCDTKGILAFSEDIGRHNAIDKVFGECLLKDIPTDDHIIITSGRVSSEILLKVAKRNVPIIISISAPLELGVKLADDLGITLIGFVRGRRMNIYANSWRVKDGRTPKSLKSPGILKSFKGG
jgi:FdhD protein